MNRLSLLSEVSGTPTLVIAFVMLYCEFSSYDQRL